MATLTLSTPQAVKLNQRAQASFLAGLFVAAIVLVLPWHLANEHHHNWNDAEGELHACTSEVEVETASHDHEGLHPGQQIKGLPDDSPLDKAHTQVEHAWAALPSKLSGPSAGEGSLTVAPGAPSVVFSTEARSLATFVDCSQSSGIPPDLQRLRGPPLT